MSRVPRIRFKGFEEDWEQRKLGEVANIVGGGTPSTSNEKYWDGNIDWYAPAEIGEQIYAFGSIRKITEEGLKHSSAKLLPAFKTVLFTSRAGIGNMAVLQKDGATNQGFQSIVCNDSLVPYFVFSMGFQIKKKAERVAAGSTFSEISGKQLCDLEIMVTTDKEQLKIGSYFQSLDHLITLHQRKLEKLKIIKKSMLENLFPKNGEKTPRIRFSRFTEDWEQRKLGEVAAFSKGSGYSKSDLKDSGVPVILYGRLYTNYETVIKEVDTFIDSIGGAVYSKGGEIITPSSGETSEDISIASVVEKSGILLGGDLNIIYPQNFLDSIFIAISISNGKPHKDMAKRAQGKSVVHLHNGDLAQIEIDYPSIDEQTRISSYFQLLDHLITLHQLEPYYLISKAIAYRIIDYAEYKLLM